MIRTKKYSISLLLVCIVLVHTAQKHSDSLYKPRFYLYAGGFVPNVNTSIRFDSKTAHLGTVLSLEDNLDFDEQPKLFRVDAIGKITKRSTVALTYLAINRKRDFTLDRTIQFMDTSFNVGAHINMYFNTTYWSFTYRYNIFAKPTWNAGLSLGGRILTVKTGITAESKRLGEYSSSSSMVVPAALIGIHGSAYLTPRFQFRYTWEYLKLDVDGTDIYIYDNNFGLEYYIIKNLGLGCSYSHVGYLVKDIPYSDEFNGEIKYTFYGFSFFLAGRF